MTRRTGRRRAGGGKRRVPRVWRGRRKTSFASILTVLVLIEASLLGVLGRMPTPTWVLVLMIAAPLVAAAFVKLTSGLGGARRGTR